MDVQENMITCVPEGDGHAAGRGPIAYKFLQRVAAAGLLRGRPQAELQRVHNCRLSAPVLARDEVRPAPEGCPS